MLFERSSGSFHFVQELYVSLVSRINKKDDGALKDPKINVGGSYTIRSQYIFFLFGFAMNNSTERERDEEKK